MSARQPFVKNAADEDQVKSSESKGKSKRERELNDLAKILSMKEGRRFLWKLLGDCKVFDSVYDTSARIHYNAGKQDVGQDLLKEITQANQKAFLEMMNESSKGEY